MSQSIIIVRHLFQLWFQILKRVSCGARARIDKGAKGGGDGGVAEQRGQVGWRGRQPQEPEEVTWSVKPY